jgi:hypothetical protein
MSYANRADGALVRTSARIADEVRSAIAGSVDPLEIADAFIDAYPLGTSLTTAQARAWALLHIRVDTRALGRALDRIYSTGYMLGRDFARGAVYQSRKIRNKAPDRYDPTQPADINWETWKPGHTPAQLLVRPPGALRDLLERTKVRALRGISKTSLDRIGTLLADALATGATDLTLARSLIEAGIKGIVRDSQRALAIATTEMNRAMSVATVEGYEEFGVDQVEWFALEGCEDCEANAIAGPRSLGDEFPSGDSEPPAHTNCRCSILPFFDDSTPVRPQSEMASFE